MNTKVRKQKSYKMKAISLYEPHPDPKNSPIGPKKAQKRPQN